MNSRKNELMSYLKACCLNSAIMYYLNDEIYVPSVKIFPQTGEVYFVSKDRHLSIIIQHIPNWNPDTDISIIESFNDDDHFHVCEGDKHENKYYTYSVMLIEESQFVHFLYLL